MEENTYLERISTLYNLKRYHDGVKETHKALAVFPESFDLHLYLSLFYFALEDLPNTASANRSAIALEPENPHAHYVRSLLAHQQLNFTLELEAAQEAVRLAPEDSDYLQRLSEAQLQSGMIKAAKLTAEEIVRLDPGGETAHEQLASICFTLEEWDKAELHYRAALAQSPTNIYHMHNLSTALNQQKKHIESLEVLYQAMLSDAGNSDLQNRLDNALAHYLPSRLLMSKRNRALKKLPSALKQYYLYKDEKRSFIERYPVACNLAIWITLLVLLVGLFSMVAPSSDQEKKSETHAIQPQILQGSNSE